MKLRHVLLIDDNDIDNYVSKHVVDQSKIAETITVKNSAIEALEFLSEASGDSLVFPDMIFLDIRMPQMDGFDFLEEFVKFPEAINEQCSVIMLSSSSDPNDVDRAMEFSVVKKFLTKPLKLQELESL